MNKIELPGVNWLTERGKGGNMFLILSDGRRVLEKDYIRAKTRDLIDFGYDDLTEDEVSSQLEKIKNGEKLSVIGEFMKPDIAEHCI